MNGNLLTVARRDGTLVTVDSTQAEKKSRMAKPSVGNGLMARGTVDATGIFRANGDPACEEEPRHVAGGPLSRRPGPESRRSFGIPADIQDLTTAPRDSDSAIRIIGDSRIRGARLHGPDESRLRAFGCRGTGRGARSSAALLGNVRVVVIASVVLISGSFASAAIIQMRLDREHALAQAATFDIQRARSLAAELSSSLDRYAAIGQGFARMLLSMRNRRQRWRRPAALRCAMWRCSIPAAI
jgi:hypothetical protein